MKMVSHLTRQALSRHRLIAAGMTATPFPAAMSAPLDASTEQTGFQMLHPLYPAAPPSQRSMSDQVPPRAPTPPAPPKPRTVYQQLMSSHDRLNERHLKHP